MLILTIIFFLIDQSSNENEESFIIEEGFRLGGSGKKNKVNKIKFRGEGIQTDRKRCIGFVPGMMFYAYFIILSILWIIHEIKKNKK